MLKFNAHKCKRMHIGRKNRKYTYRMEDKILDEAEEEKDLGEWLKNSLKPEKQVTTEVNKAIATLRSIHRSFASYNKEPFHITYRTYVRPHVEYCEQAWAPYFERHQKYRKCSEECHQDGAWNEELEL